MVELCDKMLLRYYLMSGAEDMSLQARLEMWKELRVYTHNLLVELQLVAGLKLWKREQCVKIGEIINEVEERLNTHIRKLERKEGRSSR